MKTIPRDKIIYAYNRSHGPVAYVKNGETIVIQTEDALGGQVKTAEDTVQSLDWTKINPATGPIFIEGVQPGDTLVVEVLKIKSLSKGVQITIPRHGVLAEKDVKAITKVFEISKNITKFENISLKISPMVGVIGVTPADEEISCGSPGRHGGNMDVKEITSGSTLFFPVFLEGALFAAGDVHALQSDGELCVSAIEVPAEITLKFNTIKGKKPDWPILETKDSYCILACGETIDEAAIHASEAMVEALIRQYGWSFETAYMFGSLGVDLKINQVVDPKKGVRAVISKKFVNLESLLI